MPRRELSEEGRVRRGLDRSQPPKFTYRTWGTDAPVDAGNKANVRRFFAFSARVSRPTTNAAPQQQQQAAGSSSLSLHVLLDTSSDSI
jgi:hypothetical protein